MTAPIQEPNTDRALQGMAYARDQIFRRPPLRQAAADLPYCWMKWEGSAAITVNTIYNPVSTGLDYADSFVHDPDFLAGFNCDLTLGCINWDEAGEYFVTAWAQWNGGVTVGSELGAGITQGVGECAFGTWWIGNSITASTLNEFFRIPVSTAIYSPDGWTSAQGFVWHNDAAGMDLNLFHIHAVQINPSVTGEFFS